MNLRADVRDKVSLVNTNFYYVSKYLVIGNISFIALVVNDVIVIAFFVTYYYYYLISFCVCSVGSCSKTF